MIAPFLPLFVTICNNLQMKCLQYWVDNGSSEYTGIFVTTVKEDVFRDYTVRIFNINEV